MTENLTSDHHAFRSMLLGEIEHQRSVIARMDPPNSEWDNGAMRVIRIEKLELLERLLEFYGE
jgi:hypothetical protein